MIKYLAFLGSVAAIQACAPGTRLLDVDPGECVLERVAVDDDQSSFQYDSISPDGQQIVIGWEREDKVRGTYLLSLATGDRTEVAAFDNGASFSPDGRKLIGSVYGENERTDIRQMDRVSGEVTALAPHESSEWLPSYSPDGARVVFNSFRNGDSDVCLLELETGAIRQLTSFDGYEAHAQFSPDGTRVAFHRKVGEDNFDIVVLDLQSGEEVYVTQEPGRESYPSWSTDGGHIFFSSDRDQAPGVMDLFVMTSEGQEWRRLTDHPENDVYSFSDPAGEYLYFTSYRSPQGVYRLQLNDRHDCLR